jgi:monoamine oxidase
MASLTRRRFLVGLGAAGGTGAVFGALWAIDRGDPPPDSFQPPAAGDFHLQGRVNDTSVVILGAGVAGLACAYELEKAGYTVTVLEARDRVGGRNHTVREPFSRDRWLNAGPARIASHHTTLAYCRELGVTVEPLINRNIDAFVERGGEVRRRRSVQGVVDGAVTELLVKAIDERALDSELTRAELDALRTHLETVGAVVGAGGFTEPPGAGEQAGEVVRPDELAVALGLGLDQRIAFDADWHQAGVMFHPVGGMDAIPTALADALQGDVRLGREVRSLTDGPDGVTVVVRDLETDADEELQADFGISTLPPWLAAGLDTGWDTDVVTALQEAFAFPTGKTGLEYDRRFWELDDGVFGGITSTDSDCREIWYPSTGYLGEGGVLLGAYPFVDQAERLGALTHEGRVAAAVEAGEVVHGRAFRDVAGSFSVDWTTEPYSEGGWAEWADRSRGYARLLEPAGRWRFAGDWLSYTPGWQHGALESARLTVTGLHEAALAAD